MINCKIDYKGFWAIYHLFAIIFAFMVQGFWWGILNIILPISPMVYLIKYLINTGAIIK